MEAWTTVAIALIVALSTLGATFLQNRYSAKRFKKELERAREESQQKRQWEVRSEPLLKLRDELARAAIKESEVTGAAYAQHLLKGVKSKEELNIRLERALRDRNDYLKSGILRQILYTQTDQELVDRVKEIIEDYQSSHFTAEHYMQFVEKDREEGKAVFKRNEARIIEVQELINKRLESL